MKKLWALFIAFAALLVWTMPSEAGVEFGGQYRLRAEQKSNTDFADDNARASSADKDQLGFWGQRVRLWGVAKPTDDVTVKITIQDTRNWGANQAGQGGPNLTDTGVNTLDLHESYVLIDSVFGTPFALKVGRQELVYGDERLIGSFGWSNNGRSFDAVKAMYRSDLLDVDFWTSKINENNATSVKDDNDQDFYGAYATVKTIPNNALDLYLLLLRDGSSTQMIANNNTVSGTIDEAQKLWTYGARLKGKAGIVDYTVEYAKQTGEINTTTNDYDIDADALAIRAGAAIPGAPMGLRVGGEYTVASGDGNSSDNDIETFSNLFPTNHGHYGYADQQGWRNVKAWNLYASAKVTPKTFVKLDYWNFELDEAKDGWYGAGHWNMAAPSGLRAAGCTTTTGATCSDEVGSEIDLTVKYKYNSAVTFLAGVSRFFAGERMEDYWEKNGAAGTASDTEDLDYAYVMLTANF